MRLNLPILQAAYELLAATEPFIKWNLPDGEDVTFKVAKTPRDYGWYNKHPGTAHLIAISGASVDLLPTLLETMAHEMIHLHEHQIGLRNKYHGRSFYKLVNDVCDAHPNFDRKRF